jgi:uncharacterized repeat protein (TIGR03803 family)
MHCSISFSSATPLERSNLMIRNKYGAAMGKALAHVLVTFIVVLLLASGAGAAGKYKTLYTFKGGADGVGANAGLAFDQAGNLYGTTAFGGHFNDPNNRGNGIVFKLTRRNGGWRKTELHAFDWDGKDGILPFAGVILDPLGNVYGTTYYGGAYGDNYGGCGCVFKLAPNPDGSWTESLLYSFDGANGCLPVSGLTFDAAGNLFGATEYGGSLNDGTIFKLAPNPDGTWSESMLYSFSGGDGFGPAAGLIFDAAGSLYSTTAGGGVSGYGVVFELIPNPDGTWSDTVLHSFPTDSLDGYLPYASPIFDSAASLYGTTAYGGDTRCSDGCGVIFKLTPNRDGSWTEKVLHRFTDGTHGEHSMASLIFDQAGNLYGTASGGAYGYGVVFKLTRSSDGKWREQVLHAFRDHPGASPGGGLIFDAAGNLYGTTSGDGTTTFGSVFEITP